MKIRSITYIQFWGKVRYEGAVGVCLSSQLTYFFFKREGRWGDDIDRIDYNLNKAIIWLYFPVFSESMEHSAHKRYSDKKHSCDDQYHVSKCDSGKTSGGAKFYEKPGNYRRRLILSTRNKLSVDNMVKSHILEQHIKEFPRCD